MLLRFRSLMKIQPPRLVVGCPAARGQRMPLLPVADVWRLAPGEFVNDKMWYWFTHVKITLGLTAAIFYVWHTPFAGAEYHSMWQSPRYKGHVSELRANGQYAENVRMKRTSFYTPEEMESEPEEQLPVPHRALSIFGLPLFG